MCNPEGGLREIEVAAERQEAPCLSPDQIRILARHGLALEEHYQCPQDIEWALDAEGRLIILQARPLRWVAGVDHVPESAVPVSEDHPVLVEGGAVACPGVGCGPAIHVRSDEDLLNFPEGAVFIARHSSPKFMVVMRKAQAIVTDTGSVTGHMASLTREFSVPSVLDAKGATAQIPPGALVTVDAYSCRMYPERWRPCSPFSSPGSPT